jgi:hypothetical protein
MKPVLGRSNMTAATRRSRAGHSLAEPLMKDGGVLFRMTQGLHAGT